MVCRWEFTSDSSKEINYIFGE
ncbi:hypothetical protein [Fortiea sp. LEGE XX443]